MFYVQVEKVCCPPYYLGLATVNGESTGLLQFVVAGRWCKVFCVNGLGSCQTGALSPNRIIN